MNARASSVQLMSVQIKSDNYSLVYLFITNKWASSFFITQLSEPMHGTIAIETHNMSKRIPII